MSIMSHEEKKEVLKKLLKRLHAGEDIEALKHKFSEILKQISPIEIPLIEQELVKEGIPIREILRMCDIHVELFRDALISRELKEVPKGHPLDILIKENEEIIKLAEALNIYSTYNSNRDKNNNTRIPINVIKQTLLNLYKSLRIHYMKNQMLLFPYLERMGIIAVPRVLWGREDQAIGKIRKLLEEFENIERKHALPARIPEISKEVSELVFRENKILYPTMWALLSDKEWAAIKQEGEKIGYIVDTDSDWIPSTKEVTFPYQIDGTIDTEKIAQLPSEMKKILENKKEPDKYRVARDGDLDLGTGYLNSDELKALFKSLPLEITFADKGDRVGFYSESKLLGGFVRTKTILGRRIEFCHPPRLEELVKKTVDRLKSGEKDYEVFWTKIRGRIVRVMIIAVRDENGRYLGVVEIVEDFTDILENPEKIKRRIMVL